MKVILLTHEYPPFRGGIATYCYETAKAAGEQSLPLEVWVPWRSKRARRRVIPLSNERMIFCGRRLSLLNLCLMVLALFLKRKQLRGASLIAGSVAAHRAVMLLMAMGGLRGCKLFSLLHSSEILKFHRSAFWRRLAKRFFKRAEAVFVASEFTRKLLESHFWARHIILAPCAASSAAAQEVGELKPREKEEFRVLTLARIHPRKGQLETARSLALLPEQLRAKVVYVVGGKGSFGYLWKVKVFCRQHGVRCKTLGAVADKNLARVYASCDLFMMTSRSLADSVEGFGMSYLEAAYHGKPAVAFRTGGVGEAVLHGKTGWLVNEGDLEGAAAAVRRLMEDAAMRQSFGQRAREHGRSFDWKKTARMIVQTVFDGHPYG
ncbi:MAG: glycosyltransferase family 4 protein [bacterium]